MPCAMRAYRGAFSDKENTYNMTAKDFRLQTRPRYSSEQIATALEDAGYTSTAEQYRYGYAAYVDPHVINYIVNHLADPQDNWQPRTVDQLRKGDRVRWQNPIVKDLLVCEFVVSRVASEHGGWMAYSEEESYFFPIGAVVDCIPAPVQHPDPTEHQYILVHRAAPEYNRHMFPNVGMTSGKAGYVVGKMYIPAKDILEWEELTPAKVAAVDEPVQPEDVGF